MAKRKSIAEEIAQIAAQGERPQGARAADVAREKVSRDDTTPDNAATVRPVDGAEAARGGYDAQGYRLRVRREKPHASLYAHPRVFAVIRDLATAQRCRPHDLYVEGLRMMLARHGYDLDALERGEA